MHPPYELNDTQPISTQICNCDNTGFDPNGKWNKVICTYNLPPGKLMWKVQIGERALL